MVKFLLHGGEVFGDGGYVKLNSFNGKLREVRGRCFALRKRTASYENMVRWVLGGGVMGDLKADTLVCIVLKEAIVLMAFPIAGDD